MSIKSFRRINRTFIIQFLPVHPPSGGQRPTGHMYSTLLTLNSSGWIILVLWFTILMFTLSQVYMRFFTISFAGNKEDALLTFYLPMCLIFQLFFNTRDKNKVLLTEFLELATFPSA